jgi:hypothetical protein
VWPESRFPLFRKHFQLLREGQFIVVEPPRRPVFSLIGRQLTGPEEDADIALDIGYRQSVWVRAK